MNGKNKNSVTVKRAKISMVPVVQGVVLVMLVLVFMGGAPMLACGGHCHVKLPQALHDQYHEPFLNTVFIKKDGGVYFHGRPIENLEKFHHLILDAQEERGIDNGRILLKADQRTAFGKIVDVFRVMQRAGIQSVTLVTQEHVTVLHHLRDEKRKALAAKLERRRR